MTTDEQEPVSPANYLTVELWDADVTSWEKNAQPQAEAVSLEKKASLLKQARNIEQETGNFL